MTGWCHIFNVKNVPNCFPCLKNITHEIKVDHAGGGCADGNNLFYVVFADHTDTPGHRNVSVWGCARVGILLPLLFLICDYVHSTLVWTPGNSEYWGVRKIYRLHLRITVIHPVVVSLELTLHPNPVQWQRL